MNRKDVIKKLNKIFEAEERDFIIGISDIHICDEEEFDEQQIGYRIDNDGKEIQDWIGDNYYVIGIDSCCGDPIIVNIEEKNFSIYVMYHDDWTHLIKIANSFLEFQKIMNIIEEYELIEEYECIESLQRISKIIPKESMEYWESLIESAREFYNQD